MRGKGAREGGEGKGVEEREGEVWGARVGAGNIGVGRGAGRGVGGGKSGTGEG